MNDWSAVCAGILLVIVLLHVAARLWPKQAGYQCLRYYLLRRGIKSTQIPAECIRAFVDDAYDHAHAVCTPTVRARSAAPLVPHFEFERMLRTHASVIHALITGATVDDEVRSGPDWHRCRVILGRYDLPARLAESAPAELGR